LVLAKSGYQVVQAPDLHRALEFFCSSTVDVVVLDPGSSVSTISPFARLLKTAKPQVPDRRNYLKRMAPQVGLETTFWVMSAAYTFLAFPSPSP